MNKLTRKEALELGIDFDLLIDDFYCHSSDKHRRESSFYRTSITEISERWQPDVDRSFDGFWETNSYVWDDVYGYDTTDICELTRVELRTRTVEIKEWIKIKTDNESTRN